MTEQAEPQDAPESVPTEEPSGEQPPTIEDLDFFETRSANGSEKQLER